MRVCLDTNVLAAAFATRGLGADVLRTILVDHELVPGDVILAELDRVMKHELGVPEPRRDAVGTALATATVVPHPASPHLLPLADADDRWIVATAIDGRADALVAGDRGLLAAAEAAPLAILSPGRCGSGCAKDSDGWMLERRRLVVTLLLYPCGADDGVDPPDLASRLRRFW